MTPAPPSLRALENPLTNAERVDVQVELTALLEWQQGLERWVAPRVPSQAVSRAMPIVSVYARGMLRGCFAQGEGPAQHRLARAFLAALSDTRFDPISEDMRGELVAQVAYPICLRQLDVTRATLGFAAGVHGLALIGSERSALLVPDVARDLGLDEEGFVRALEEKSQTPRAQWGAGSVFAFETERVVARAAHPAIARPTPLTGALDWLSNQVEPDGSVRFGLDLRTGEVWTNGFLRHARAATLVQALALSARHRAAHDRSRAWLHAEVQRALAGQSVHDWPSEPALVAGTVALCCLAGLSLEPALLALAGDSALHAEPWHAAQVAAALGSDAPAALWQACVDALEREAFAPWTAIAAKRRGDSHTLARALEGLCSNVPTAEFGFVAEPALAALTVEALALDGSSHAEHVTSLALLKSCQLWADNFPAPRPEWVHGAFAVAPNQSFSRIDVTAHAALALATDFL